MLVLDLVICFSLQQVGFFKRLLIKTKHFSLAVLMSELVKLLTCLWLVFREEGRTVAKLKEAVNSQIIKQPYDTLKVCVPSMIYVIQNNLLYVAASHLDAATYQVTFDKCAH